MYVTIFAYFHLRVDCYVVWYCELWIKPLNILVRNNTQILWLGEWFFTWNIESFDWLCHLCFWNLNLPMCKDSRLFFTWDWFNDYTLKWGRIIFWSRSFCVSGTCATFAPFIYGTFSTERCGAIRRWPRFWPLFLRTACMPGLPVGLAGRVHACGAKKQRPRRPRKGQVAWLSPFDAHRGHKPFYNEKINRVTREKQ